MDMWTATEEAYKNGYEKGYEDGKRNRAEVIYCMNCMRSDPTKYPKDKVWCRKMCTYMNKNGFCSEGKSKVN